jgi:hypothetical protein
LGASEVSFFLLNQFNWFLFNLNLLAELWDNVVRVSDVVLGLDETYPVVDVEVNIFIVVVDLWHLGDGLLLSGHAHHLDGELLGIIDLLLLVSSVLSLLLILDLPPVW